MKDEVKELRMRIDNLAQLTKGLEPGIKKQQGYYINEDIGKEEILIFANSDQIDKATDDLFLAKAWLGKLLGELGTASPYPKDGTRHSVADIEPTADTSEVLTTTGAFGLANNDTWQDKNHIEKVDWLRQTIQEIVNLREIENHPYREVYYKTSMMWCYFEAKKHLSEARFWLGFELERIRKEDHLNK